MVPYLGFLSDSVRMVFHLIAEKKGKFLNLIRETLSCRVVSVKTLQRLAGKCISFSLVVPGALLFTREMNCAISNHITSHHRSCTMVVLDLYPRKYWWPLIQKYSTKFRRLAHRGDHNALLKPSAAGWVPHPGLPGDLWAYALNFH